MEITLTWHLLVMIVITVILLIGIFKNQEGLNFSPFFNIAVLLILWAIYGGIFYW